MQCTSLNDVHSSQSHRTTPQDSSEVCLLLCHWCHPINSAHLPHIYPAHILFPISLYTVFITSTNVLLCHWCHPINSAHLPHIYPAHILFPIFLYTFFITCTDVCYVILLIRHTCHIYKPSAVQDGKSLITISKHWIWMQTLRREELNISKSNTHPPPFLSDET